MKFIFLSDLHLSWESSVARLDKNFVEMQFEKLKFVFDYAQKHDCIILQAGDFFDKPRSWWLLPKIIVFLKDYSDVNVYSIFGQHDMYMRSDDASSTNLGVLEKSGLIKILKDFPWVFPGQDLDIYGCSWDQDVPEIKRKASHFNILVIHAPIAENALWHGHEYMDAEKFLEKNKDFDIILCGDIHRKFCIEKNGRYILNAGPMIRREANEYNFTHKICFFVYDTETTKMKEEIIPHRKAEEVLSRDHIEREKEIDVLLDDFISSIKEDFEGGINLSENIRIFMEQHNISENIRNIISKVMSEKGE